MISVDEEQLAGMSPELRDLIAEALPIASRMMEPLIASTDGDRAALENDVSAEAVAMVVFGAAQLMHDPARRAVFCHRVAAEAMEEAIVGGCTCKTCQLERFLYGPNNSGTEADAVFSSLGVIVAKALAQVDETRAAAWLAKTSELRDRLLKRPEYAIHHPVGRG